MPLASSLTNLIPSDDMQGLMRRIEALESEARGVPALVQQMVGPQIAKITAAQDELTSTVDNLASRVTTTASIPTFNTGSLPNDASFHPYGTPFAITIAVPTGKIVVKVGCGQATLNSGGAAVEADATFSISGGVVSMMSVASSAWLSSSSTGIGAPLSQERSFSVTPGTYTITAQMYAWASGTATASVNFQQPYLTVQVTG